jgi:hypothetical protein
LLAFVACVDAVEAELEAADALAAAATADALAAAALTSKAHLALSVLVEIGREPVEVCGVKT